MKALKSARTLAASLGVLAVGAMAASPAMAFDDVDWDWYKDVKETVDIYADIDFDNDPTGLVEVEKLQIFLGDVHAYNHVSHIYNNPLYPTPYADGGGDTTVNVTVIQNNVCAAAGGGGGAGVVGDGGAGGSATAECSNTSAVTVNLSDWEVKINPLDARTELPILLASATAVGNNQSIRADVPIFIHDGQFVADVDETRECQWVCDAYSALPTTADTDDYNGNLHHTVALLFGIGAITGELTKSSIEAYSQVEYVANVSVDNSSTAVANNISVNLASDDPENHVVIADITQFALADVKAQTYTHNVTATGYSHMRELTTPTLSPTDENPTNIVNVPTPWVSSTATAVGNNVSINVGNVLAE